MRRSCHHVLIVTENGGWGAYQFTFKWVTAILGNVKNALQGTFHAVSVKHAPHYRAEFEYRFNRRFDLRSMINRLLSVSSQTPPLAYRLLKMAATYGYQLKVSMVSGMGAAFVLNARYDQKALQL